MADNLYCGACSGWMKFIRPPHYKFFNEECRTHDELYSVGGSKVERLEADRTLFHQMVRRSVGYYENRKIFALWWFVTLAYLYYLAVRVCGKSRFNYLKNENTQIGSQVYEDPSSQETSE